MIYRVICAARVEVVAPVAPQHELAFRHLYDLPREIVWDALVDPDLAAGWLAALEIEPLPGGVYTLTWLGGAEPVGTVWPGRIAKIAQPSALAIDFLPHSYLAFQLHDREGGTRGRSTSLDLSYSTFIESSQVDQIKEDWNRRLWDLEDLLRGHPVDWVNWQK